MTACRRKISAAFLAAALLALCRIPAAAQLAAVGRGAVTETDLADWQAAQACYGPGAIVSRKAGFLRLLEAAILDETLTRVALRPITREEYAVETARIDAETRAPEILACIKKYFGGGAARYERVFVRPILAQRFIREHVKSDPKVQAAAYGLRDKISKEAADGVPFPAIRTAPEVKYASAAYSLEPGTAAPAAGEPWSRWSPFQTAFIEEHLSALKPGEAEPNPVEDELSIKFVRLLGVEGGSYYFETLTVPKISTEEYLKRGPKIPCRINDRELRDWAASIKGNPLLAPAQISPWVETGKEKKKEDSK